MKTISSSMSPSPSSPTCTATFPGLRRSSPTSSAAGSLAHDCAWATSSATGLRPTRSPCSSATAASPRLMGNYDQGIGFETGDCGCVYKTDEQRAEGAVSLAWTQEVVTDEVKAYLRTLEDHFVLRTRRARSSPSTAARAASTSISSRIGRPPPWNAWRVSTHTRPSSSGTRTSPTRGRSARRRFVNVGSGGRPKDGDWRVCYAIVDPARLGEAPGSWSSLAWPTTTSGCSGTLPARP